jgi:hypothetical protein
MRAVLDDGTEVHLVITYAPYQPATYWGPEEGEYYIETLYNSNGERLYIELTDAELDRFEREYIDWKDNLNDY